jgi:hypothetical protein
MIIGGLILLLGIRIIYTKTLSIKNTVSNTKENIPLVLKNKIKI